MACHLIGAKPSPEPVPGALSTEPLEKNFCEILIISNIFIEYNAFEITSANWRPFCLDPIVSKREMYAFIVVFVSINVCKVCIECVFDRDTHNFVYDCFKLSVHDVHCPLEFINYNMFFVKPVDIWNFELVYLLTTSQIRTIQMTSLRAYLCKLLHTW